MTSPTDDVAGDIMDNVKTETSNYPLRLPASLKPELEALAVAEKLSLNALIVAILSNATGRAKDGTLWQEVRRGKTA